jgi:small subunit ribosomal protein S13
LANVIVAKAGLAKDTRLGLITENKVREIEHLLENPKKDNIPSWLLNRRKDRVTGNHLHLIGANIDLQVKSDIEDLKTIKSWRGYRHSYGLKVRGQKTRTTSRTHKSVGVKKKRIIAERRKI